MHEASHVRKRPAHGKHLESDYVPWEAGVGVEEADFDGLPRFLRGRKSELIEETMQGAESERKITCQGLFWE